MTTTVDPAKVLEQVKGVGAATRTAVLDAFPTLNALEEASTDDLTEIKGVGPSTAAAIKEAVAEARVADDADAVVADVGRADQARARVAATAAKTKKELEAEVVKLESARDNVSAQADTLITQVKGAITSLQNIITAALDAGKDQWPQTERQLKAALTSLRKTGRTLVDAAKELRSTDDR